MALWRGRHFEIDLRSGALVGVVNVTPDSFSDGGDNLEPDRAITSGLALAADGAAMVDVGGESARPGAQPIGADLEIARVLPVIEGLSSAGIRVSVDTSKPAVARAAVAAGAVAINDITGFRSREMVSLAAATGVGVVVMHMKGEPRTMQDDPSYDDVVAEVAGFLEERAAQLVEAGVEPNAIVVDPGFGFGKTVGHNLELVKRINDITALGYPVMLGTSRKSTLGALTGRRDARARDVATAVTTALGFERGARLFRVHDVAGSHDALRIAAAIVDPQTWEEWQQD